MGLQRILTGVAGAGLGAMLVFFATPALLAAFANIPGNAIVARLQYGLPVDTALLPVLIDSRERALRWFDAGDDRSELGLGQALRAVYDPALTREEREHLLGAAITNQVDSLATVPHSGTAWLRLAADELAVASLTPQTLAQPLAHLRLSSMLAPNDRRMALDRVALLLPLWDQLTAMDRADVERQTLLLWENRRNELLLMTERAGTSSRLRPIVARSLDDLRALERGIARAQEQLRTLSSSNP